MLCSDIGVGVGCVSYTAHTRKLQQGLAHHNSHMPVEGADKPSWRRRRRRRRRRRQLGGRTARALTWLLLALRRIDHHGIGCLHWLRPPLEDLRRQPARGWAASARASAWLGLGALQFWQRKASEF